MNSNVFWNVTECSLVEVHWRFGGKFCLYLHSWNGSKASIQQKAVAIRFLLITRFVYSLTPKMEAGISSETSVNFYRAHPSRYCSTLSQRLKRTAYWQKLTAGGLNYTYILCNHWKSQRPVVSKYGIMCGQNNDIYIRVCNRIMKQGGLPVTLQIWMQKVLSSNLGQDTGYTDWGIPHSLKENTMVVPRLDYDRFLPSPYQFMIRHPNATRSQYWKSVLN
jgi:hypothetical protein